MLFNSSLFLLYFLPAFLILYYLADKRYRNGLVIIASTFFFAWGAPIFTFIILASVLVDHYLIKWMLSKEGKPGKRILTGFILLNLGLLLYFKYTHFFIQNLNEILHLFKGKDITFNTVILPIGVSFIVFQKICYALDVYRKVHPPARSLANYMYYILMFPKLFAGPIARYRDIGRQIDEPVEVIAYDDRLNGFLRFTVGLAKKVLIANVLGTQVDLIFAIKPEALTTGLAWTGALAYTFQIYFDFSGYTDMAIGIAAMMGFKFPENFNNPYTSFSITEFWKRWHMTLSSWLRDFVFLPRAYSSSRRMKKERYWGLKTEQWIYMEATAVTMLACGFWHGAAWTFIVWGGLQGLIMIIERLFLIKFYKKTSKYLGVVLTFFFTVCGWVIFRSESMDYAIRYFHRMFSFLAGENQIYLNSRFWTILIMAVVFSFLGINKAIEKIQNRIFSPEKTLVAQSTWTFVSVVLFVLSLATITSTGFSPFIYFRF